jgi:REP element-mobilizing transposase RayT
MKQESLGFISKRQLFFGGSLLKKSHAKMARPLHTKLPVHLVFRSSQARGERSLRTLANARKIRAILKQEASRFGIRVLDFSNNFNHLHLLVQSSNRRMTLNFMRSFAGKVAMAVSGARKGASLNENFWDQRPFSRVVVGYRGLSIARDYLALNQMEALGIFTRSRVSKAMRVRTSSA